jgi:hypothetical protein
MSFSRNQQLSLLPARTLMHGGFMTTTSPVAPWRRRCT